MTGASDRHWRGGAVRRGRRAGPSGRRSQSEWERAAGLWSIRRALIVASITAVVGLIMVMTAVLVALGFPYLKHEPLTTSRSLEVLKLVLVTLAGVGALFAW